MERFYVVGVRGDDGGIAYQIRDHNGPPVVCPEFSDADSAGAAAAGLNAMAAAGLRDRAAIAAACVVADAEREALHRAGLARERNLGACRRLMDDYLGVCWADNVEFVNDGDGGPPQWARVTAGGLRFGVTRQHGYDVLFIAAVRPCGHEWQSPFIEDAVGLHRAIEKMDKAVADPNSCPVCAAVVKKAAQELRMAECAAAAEKPITWSENMEREFRDLIDDQLGRNGLV